MRWTRLVLAWASLCAGCQRLPDFEYETTHLRLATDFEAPLCAGTLEQLDRAAGRIAAAFAPTRDQLFGVYWLEHGLEDRCDDDASGCFYPATGVVFASGESIAHELVHATIDSPATGYFVEEGIAELFGGGPVQRDPSELKGRLEGQLELSSRDYRHGVLSYREAAHFMRWVYETEGIDALERLADALREEDPGASLPETFEDVFGGPLWSVEKRYGEEARRSYPGLYDDDIPTVGLDDGALWMTIPLDCDDDEVIGPLPGRARTEPPHSGMARLRWLHVSERRELRLRVDGAPGTWVEVRDRYRSRATASPMWWPALDDDGRVTRLEPGDMDVIVLDPASYLLVFGSDDTEATEIELQILRP